MRTSLGTLLESGESGSHLLEGDVDDQIVRLQALARGYHFIDLDCRPANDKATLMDCAQRAFDLPAHFGRNWDALADCIMDLSWSGGVRWVVLARGLERLHALDPDSYAVLMNILAEAGEYWEEQEQPFIALFTEDCGPAAMTLPPVVFA